MITICLLSLRLGNFTILHPFTLYIRGMVNCSPFTYAPQGPASMPLLTSFSFKEKHFFPPVLLQVQTLLIFQSLHSMFPTSWSCSWLLSCWRFFIWTWKSLSLLCQCHSDQQLHYRSSFLYFYMLLKKNHLFSRLLVYPPYHLACL